MKILQETSLSYLISLIKSKLNLKFDKAGGEITGNVKIDNTLTLNIDYPNYDSGIYFQQGLDDNVGTTLTLGGYKYGQDKTQYKVVLRNIADPKDASDAATKQYVEMEIDRRQPVVIYDVTEGLKVPGSLVDGFYTEGVGLVTTSQGEDTSKGTITKWNITGADFSQFKYLRVVYKRNSTDSGTTAEFNIPLDCLPIDGTGQKYFAAGAQSLAYGDRNRFNCIICGVDEVKTKFAVLQTFSLYGTTVTEINDIRVVRIEGIYKDANPYPIANHAEEVEF